VTTPMPKRACFDRACASLGALEKPFEAWVSAARAETGGDDVVENLFEEQILEDANLTTILSEIAQAWSGGASPQAAHSIVADARFRFAGTPSAVSAATVLHTTLNLKDAKVFVADAIGDPDPDRAWAALWHPSLRPDERLALLQSARIFDPATSTKSKAMMWVYFDESIAIAGGASNPLATVSAHERCNSLGVPDSWYNYRRGEPLVGLSYFLKSNTALVPTVADALAWNPYFQPSHLPRGLARWGYTRPLGMPRGAQGVPEAVHATGALIQCAEVPNVLGPR